MTITTEVVRLKQIGGPEVLNFETVELPEPGPGEVRVRHRAIGLNYADVYVRTGHFPHPVPFPSTIGSEAAGVIEAVGQGVSNFKVGDRVCYGGGSPGAYSWHRNMTTDRLVKTPEGISDEVAAASLLKGMAVEYLFHRCYPIKSGQQVLFYAASGGVGLMAGQWGKYLGAQMIGVAGGAAKCQLALQNGYTHVIDRSREDIVARMKELTDSVGVPVVFDSVGKATFDTTLKCLAARGMFVSFGMSSGPVPPIEAGMLQKLGSLYFTRPTLVTYTASRGDLEASSAKLFDMIIRGAIKININRRYPLADVRQAHMDLEGGRTTGSSILVP